MNNKIIVSIIAVYILGMVISFGNAANHFNHREHNYPGEKAFFSTVLWPFYMSYRLQSND